MKYVSSVLHHRHSYMYLAISLPDNMHSHELIDPNFNLLSPGLMA